MTETPENPKSILVLPGRAGRAVEQGTTRIVSPAGRGEPVAGASEDAVRARRPGRYGHRQLAHRVTRIPSRALLEGGNLP